MLKKILPLSVVGLMLVAGLVLNGCGFGGPAFDEVNRSGSGILIEETLPADTWFLMDFTTLDESQQEYFGVFIEKFSDDPEAFRSDLLAGIDANLDSVDLSYMEDISPILGEEGIRFVMAMSDGDSDTPVMHAALTLQDANQAQELLNTLEAEGRFVKTTKNGYDLYFNVTAAEQGEDVYYFALYEDVFLIADNDEELTEMIDLTKSEGSESLWTKESYQIVIDELPAIHLGMVFMDGERLAERQNELGAAALSDKFLEYLTGEGFAFVAMEEGLDFQGVAIGDREKIDAAETSLDELNAEKSYLMGDMPGSNLGVYMESYNLASAALQQFAGNEPQLEATLAMLGVTLADFELLFAEGYAMAFHENSGVFPGLTIMVDMSEEDDTAAEFLISLDAQVTSLVGLFQFQGGAMADALTKEDLELQGGDFHALTLDIDSMMGIYDPEGIYALPDQMEGQEIVLLYGLTKHDGFVISTYDGWLKNPNLMLDEMPDYEETLAYLKGAKEGIVYVDFSEIIDFVETFQGFQEALSVDVEAITDEELAAQLEEMEASVEEVAEGTEVEEVVVAEELEPIDWAELLAPFRTFAFSSDAEKYKVELKGVVLLGE